MGESRKREENREKRGEESKEERREERHEERREESRKRETGPRGADVSPFCSPGHRFRAPRESKSRHLTLLISGINLCLPLMPQNVQGQFCLRTEIRALFLDLESQNWTCTFGDMRGRQRLIPEIKSVRCPFLLSRGARERWPGEQKGLTSAPRGPVSYSVCDLHLIVISDLLCFSTGSRHLGAVGGVALVVTVVAGRVAVHAVVVTKDVAPVVEGAATGVARGGATLVGDL